MTSTRLHPHRLCLSVPLPSPLHRGVSAAVSIPRSKTIIEWEKKGMLAQYLASRSCKRAVEDADTALRGALQRLVVSQPITSPN